MEEVSATGRPDVPALYLLVLGRVPGLWLPPRLLLLMGLPVAHDNHGSLVLGKRGGTQEVRGGLLGGRNRCDETSLTWSERTAYQKVEEEMGALRGHYSRLVGLGSELWF